MGQYRGKCRKSTAPEKRRKEKKKTHKKQNTMPEDKSASCINFIRLRRDRLPSVTSGECWGVNVACLLTEEVRYWWQHLRMCRQSVDLRSVSRSSGTGGPRFLTCAFKAPHAARPPAGSWVTEDLVKGISCFEWQAPLLPPVCHRSQWGWGVS